MIPVWPSTLPDAVLREGFSLQRPDPRLRTRTDTGPGRTAAINSSRGRNMRASFRMRADQIAIFDAFWENDLGNGVRPFWLRDQIRDRLALADHTGAVLLDHTGAPLGGNYLWLVEFGAGPFDYTARAGFLFTFSFDMIVHRRPGS